MRGSKVFEYNLLDADVSGDLSAELSTADDAHQQIIICIYSILILYSNKLPLGYRFSSAPTKTMVLHYDAAITRL